jgi:hypothetical protein
VKRKVFSMQFMWRLGEAFDDLIVRLPGQPFGCGSITVELRDTDLSVSITNALYMQGVEDAVALTGAKFLSGSFDKPRVHSYGMMNGAYALPGNVAFWAVPQEKPTPSHLRGFPMEKAGRNREYLDAILGTPLCARFRFQAFRRSKSLCPQTCP